MNAKTISLVTLLVVMALTCALYLVVFTEHTPLLYINMVSACLMELGLLGTLSLFSNSRLLEISNASVALQIRAYTTLLFVWTTVYSIFLTHMFDTHKWLYVGYLAISILGAFRIGMTALAGNVATEENAQVEAVAATKKVSIVNVKMLINEVKSELSALSSPSREDAEKRIELALDKISTIPSAKFDRASSALDGILQRLERVRQLCADKKESDAVNEIVRLNEYIDLIKTTL